jgi:hypothetical protein
MRNERVADEFVGLVIGLFYGTILSFPLWAFLYGCFHLIRTILD